MYLSGMTIHIIQSEFQQKHDGTKSTRLKGRRPVFEVGAYIWEIL